MLLLPRVRQACRTVPFAAIGRRRRLPARARCLGFSGVACRAGGRGLIVLGVVRPISISPIRDEPPCSGGQNNHRRLGDGDTAADGVEEGARPAQKRPARPHRVVLRAGAPKVIDDGADPYFSCRLTMVYPEYHWFVRAAPKKDLCTKKERTRTTQAPSIKFAQKTEKNAHAQKNDFRECDINSSTRREAKPKDFTKSRNTPQRSLIHS